MRRSTRAPGTWDLGCSYADGIDDAIYWLIHVAALARVPARFRSYQAVEHRTRDLVTLRVAQRDGNIVGRPCVGLRDRGVTARGDGPARLLQVLDLEPAHDEPRVIRHRVEQGDVAGDLGQIHQGDRVDRVEMISHALAVRHRDLGVA